MSLELAKSVYGMPFKKFCSSLYYYQAQKLRAVPEIKEFIFVRLWPAIRGSSNQHLNVVQLLW